jgi:hypothetical protein
VPTTVISRDSDEVVLNGKLFSLIYTILLMLSMENPCFILNTPNSKTMKNKLSFITLSILMIVNMAFNAVIYQKIDKVSDRQLYDINEAVKYLVTEHNQEKMKRYDDEVRRNLNRNR